MSSVYIFLFLGIFQALFVITSKNSIISVLSLICVYMFITFGFLVIGAEYVGILLIMIYIGALTVLFVFVIVMLDLRILEVYILYIIICL